MSSNPSAFETELRKRIKAKVAELKKEGTTGVGLACLRQQVSAPGLNFEGYPATFGEYNELFTKVAREVCSPFLV